MRKDAEAHAEDDRQHREEVETRNEADNAVYRSEKMLKDNADKISGGDRSNLEKAIADVKEALKGSDPTAIKAASERLNQAWQSVSAELYKAASDKARAGKEQPGGGAPQPGAEPKAEAGHDEGTVIDAEVVDEKK